MYVLCLLCFVDQKLGFVCIGIYFENLYVLDSELYEGSFGFTIIFIHFFYRLF